ncbi:MAG: nitroreductase family protein [Candidatus Aminicenantaceae bacterium]
MKSAPDSPFRRLIEDRKSIRRYEDRPVEREVLLQCLDAARIAPSAENAQPWRFLVIDDPEIKARFSDEVFSGIYKVTKFAAQAPVLILFLARLNVVTHHIGRQVQNIHFHYIDIGIAGQHLALQAEELGVGSCWLGWFSVRKARRFFNIPSKYKIISMQALGYYDKKPSKERKRKPLEEIAWFNRLGGS